MGHVIKQVFCYWHPSDDAIQLTKNFKVGEFHSRNYSQIFVEQELLEKLQTLRTYLGYAVEVNSGYRTQAHNEAVGGSSNSAHLWGCAADIHTNRIKSPELAQVLQTLFGKQIAIGLHTAENYCHLDTVYRGNWYKEKVSNKVDTFF